MTRLTFNLLHLLFMGHCITLFFFSSRRRHTSCLSDWSSDVCSSDLFEVMFVFRNPFALACAHLNPVRAAIEADAIDVVHHHRAVVRVVNHRDVDVGHRAIVDKLSATPFAAPETNARVAVPIIDTAIKADVRPPVAGAPYINTFREAPITRRPQETRLRRHYPRSRHPIISFVSVSPVSGSPDVAWPWQISWAYTGRTGGPTRTETPTAICAWDGAGTASIAPTSSSNPSDVIIRMILTSSAAFTCLLNPGARKIGLSINPLWPEKSCCGSAARYLCALYVTRFLCRVRLGFSDK